MLATHSSFKCCFNGRSKQVMDQPIILTLKDNISSELLQESKTNDNILGNSSSVEFWIKSLSNNSDADDSKSEQNSYLGSCSDLDDLQLGAEANDLKKRTKSDYSPSDSEDNRSYFKSKNYLFTRNKSSERSLDSDVSARSSTTSVSSLLSARESDPEEVLKAAGFGGLCVIDCIPKRFLTTGTKCDGIDTHVFFSSIKKQDTDTTIPRCVMARADDIPRKFLLSNTMVDTTGPGLPVFSDDEPGQDNGLMKKPSKPAPSKFGSFLEPVSEELEEQGSMTSQRDVSFESNRSQSTLKADSRDESIESGNKIPSLKDLWGSTAYISSDGSLEPQDTQRDQLLLHDVVMGDKSEHIPGLMGYYSDENDCTEALVSFECENLNTDDKGYDESGSEHLPCLNNAEYLPGLTDYFVGDRICKSNDEKMFTAGQHLTEILESPIGYSNNCSPSISIDSELESSQVSKLTLESAEISEAQSVRNSELSCSSESSLFEDAPLIQTNDSGTLRRMKSIPSITISDSSEPHQEISTVDPPDYKILQPELLEDTTLFTIPENKIPGGLGKVIKKIEKHSYANRCQMSFLINSIGKCVCIKNKLQSQINILSNYVQNSGKSRNQNSNITITKPTRFPRQILFKKSASKIIECFSKLSSTARRTDRRTISLLRCQRSSGFCSLATQSDHANESPTENVALGVHGEKSDHVSGANRCEKETRAFCDEKDSVNLWRTGNEGGTAVEEELYGLQSSLKGIKIYKAGIHLMQLASSVDTVIAKPVGRLRSCQILLDSIQRELKDSEDYIFHLQKRLSKLKKEKTESFNEDRRGSDFSEMTTQLLQEQLKMFTSITNSMSPTSTPSTSTEDEQSGTQNELIKLRCEIQTMRKENQNRHLTLKKEILSEVKTEIQNCFKEFVHR